MRNEIQVNENFCSFIAVFEYSLIVLKSVFTHTHMLLSFLMRERTHVCTQSQVIVIAIYISSISSH